jgi:gluconate kinase
MIIYLYGLPATGKNFIGEIIKEKYNFYFQDADLYLPQNMKIKLRNKEHFTIEEVANYHEMIAHKIFELKSIHENLVISQASLFTEHREKIKKINPEVKFILVSADLETMLERIDKRRGLVTKDYAIHLLKYLQISENDNIINNNKDQTKETIIAQMEKMLILSNSDSR